MKTEKKTIDNVGKLLFDIDIISLSKEEVESELASFGIDVEEVVGRLMEVREKVSGSVVPDWRDVPIEQIDQEISDTFKKPLRLGLSRGEYINEILKFGSVQAFRKLDQLSTDDLALLLQELESNEDE